MKYKNKLNFFSKGLDLKTSTKTDSKRRSSIHLIYIPLNMLNYCWLWYFFFKIMWGVHVLFYPSHKGKFNLFWNENIPFFPFLSSFLMMMPLFFAVLPFALILSNLIVYSIPFLRRRFDKDVEKTGGKSCKKANIELLNVSRILTPICLLLSFIGAITLINLK